MMKIKTFDFNFLTSFITIIGYSKKIRKDYFQPYLEKLMEITNLKKSFLSVRLSKINYPLKNKQNRRIISPNNNYLVQS